MEGIRNLLDQSLQFFSFFNVQSFSSDIKGTSKIANNSEGFMLSSKFSSFNAPKSPELNNSSTSFTFKKFMNSIFAFKPCRNFLRSAWVFNFFAINCESLYYFLGPNCVNPYLYPLAVCSKSNLDLADSSLSKFWNVFWAFSKSLPCTDESRRAKSLSWNVFENFIAEMSLLPPSCDSRSLLICFNSWACNAVGALKLRSSFSSL